MTFMIMITLMTVLINSADFRKKTILIVTIAVIVTLMSAVEIMITISNSIDNDDDTGIEHAFAIIMTGT